MAESEPNSVATEDSLWEAECARRTLLSHLGITPLASRFDPIAAKPAQRLEVPTGFNGVALARTPATPNGGDEMYAAKLREMLRGDADETASTEEAGARSRAPAEEYGQRAAAPARVLQAKTNEMEVSARASVNKPWRDSGHDCVHAPAAAART